MRISQARRSSSGHGSRAGRSAGSGGGPFQLPGARPAVHRPDVSGPASAGGIDAIVALQAMEEPADQRRQAVESGGRILDLLDRLKIGLLSGQVRTADLNSLRRAIERQQNLEGDPGLNEVLRQIDLRARVELAKLKGNAA